MGQIVMKIIVGCIVAILSASILIYAVESHKSLNQIFLAFILFIIPFSLLSVFFSRVGSFILTFTSLIVGYIVIKYSYNDFWLGIVMAALIGGAVYVYITIPSIKRMNDHKPFSPNEYKRQAKDVHVTKNQTR